jgi:hypothetical protein
MMNWAVVCKILDSYTAIVVAACNESEAIRKAKLESSFNPEAIIWSVKPQRIAIKRRVRIWENSECRAEVLARLIPEPAAYCCAGWLLKNKAHIHLSLSLKAHEEGKLEEFVRSEISDVRDSDVSVASEATMGSTFTAVVGTIRPPEHVLQAFEKINVSPSVYRGVGTTVQKWGFVFDFLMVELGVGFNHDIGLKDVASRIQNVFCREAFLAEIGEVE